jgi:hypothetical protein
MHTWMIPLVAGLALCTGAAQAQVQKMQPHNDKAALCEKAAAGKKGDARKAFLNSCMSAQSVSTHSVASRTDARPMTAYGGCEHGSKAEDL